MKRQQKTAQLEQLSPICGRVKVKIIVKNRKS